MGGLDEKERDKGDLTKVEQGSKKTKKAGPYYVRISKQYVSLPAFLVNPDPHMINSNSLTTLAPKKNHRSKHRLKVE